MIFRQCALVTRCVQNFMLVPKCRIKITEFWPKLTFLLEQQTKFVFISCVEIMNLLVYMFRKYFRPKMQATDFP